MNFYCVSYNLTSDKDYYRILRALQQFDDWCNPLLIEDPFTKSGESFYIIKTVKTIFEVNEDFKKHLYPDDHLFIASITPKDWQFMNLHEEVIEWLNNNS